MAFVVNYKKDEINTSKVFKHKTQVLKYIKELDIDNKNQILFEVDNVSLPYFIDNGSWCLYVNLFDSNEIISLTTNDFTVFYSKEEFKSYVDNIVDEEQYNKFKQIDFNSTISQQVGDSFLTILRLGV